MTQVIVIGDNNKVATKKIQLIKCLQPTKDHFREIPIDPSTFKYIELISKNYTEKGEDLIFCHDGDRNIGGILFLGHFNDGIV